MTTNSKLTYEFHYPFRSYEILPNKCLSIVSVCNHLQDIAARHADKMGFGFQDLEKTGNLWVLARLRLVMDEMPHYSVPLTATVTTWPSGNERLVANRDFTIHMGDKLIGRATTAWVIIDYASRKPTRPEDSLDSRLIPDRERALTFDTRAIKRLKEGVNNVDILTRRSDMDINAHVNSIRYVEFCLDSAPQDWMGDKCCVGVDVQFRNEAHAGQTLRSSSKECETDEGTSALLHSLTRPSDNKEIVRMESIWR